MELKAICQKLRESAVVLANQTAQQKNLALESVCEEIENQRELILAANKSDVAQAEKKGMSKALVERLALDDKKINGIINGIKTVISQTDPIGEEIAGWKLPNGVTIRQVRVPIGVAAIIYESRPNVTADAFCLAYKSGNAILLRGSSSALKSNLAIQKAIKDGLSKCPSGIPGAIHLVESTDHEDVEQILSAVGLIDVALPRGGANLINMVVEKAKIPVIQTGAGVCHLFVDESADLEKAAVIAENAKIQRPGACNAIETILVHRKVAEKFLPLLEKQFAGRVELRAEDSAYSILKAEAEKNGRTTVDGKTCIVKASEEDFGYEFLSFVCSVKIIDGIDEAISFINAHNTKHSECIVTNNRENARKFQQNVDAACVYVNASTRFTDGGEFGFGMELGISTQKLHARGPMGIKALTTTKYLIDGDGQIR